jgi:predicted aspartyl protease
MMDDMGIFRTAITVAHPARPDQRHELPDVLVDTGSEYNWIPRRILEELGVRPDRTERFDTANGQVLERDVGSALISAGGRTIGCIVTFAEPGDMALLGAIGLESLNLKLDLARRELVPPGPVLAAAAA